MAHGDPLPPDTVPADEKQTDNIERVGGHGNARDLARHPMFDGRQNPHERPDNYVDPQTGAILRPHISGGMEAVGEENGSTVTAERNIPQPAPEFTALRVPCQKSIPVPLLYEDVRRGYVRIVNESTNTDPVLIGTLPMVQGQQGFVLAPGQAIEPSTSAPIYAMVPNSAVGGAVTVSVWAERHP